MSKYKNLSESEKHNSDWMNTKWRPMMGWMYMTVCAFDFMIAPILWSVLQALGNHGHVETQWEPLTLQGAGLFHVAMGAVLGIAAYGRTQEKLSGVAVGQPTLPTNNFGSPAPAFGSPAPAFGSKPFGPAPVQQPPL
jgi:hypothetical protein